MTSPTSDPSPESPADVLARAKEHARALARTARAAAYLADPRAGARIRDRFFAELWPLLPKAPAVVSAYMPIRDELDPRPLMERLHGDGVTVAVPALNGPKLPLAFRRWEPFMTLVPGQLEVPEPTHTAPVVAPDLLLVPLLAFDRRGHRLGYGRGYYDRTLATLRASRTVTAVGLAFAAQEVVSVPAGERDERLDWVLTEAALIRPQS
ncbi:MAG: 5-formyltetrahydrofolate cyclo-ligase [Gemmatimonas sp.]